jgi:aspartate racemase
MHIGLIGGIGPAATDCYYRGLIGLHAASGVPLELTIVHADVRELVQNLSNNDVRKQADKFLQLIRRLEAAGARAAAITSIAGHFCIRELEQISPLPIINVVPEIDEVIYGRNLKKVGILGTRTVMESRLYGGILSANVVLPEGDSLEQVQKCYVDLAIAGHATDAQRSALFSIGRRLCSSQGAEVVILGGTDLFLAFDGQDCGFPVIDCAQVHIGAIYRQSSGAA